MTSESTSQSHPNLDVHAVVLAGGMGTRFGSAFPKQLVPLAGHPILHHTLRKFNQPELIKSVVIAGNTNWTPEIEKICKSSLTDVPWTLVPGGTDRNASLRNALAALPATDDIVLIHDAVRPLVSLHLITIVADAMRSARSVLPAIASSDLIVEVAGNHACGFADRKSFLRGQSPQGFRLSDLKYTFARGNDEATAAYSTVYEAVKAMTPDLEIVIVAGDPNNLKITMPVDHLIAGRLLLEE